MQLRHLSVGQAQPRTTPMHTSDIGTLLTLSLQKHMT